MSLIFQWLIDTVRFVYNIENRAGALIIDGLKDESLKPQSDSLDFFERGLKHPTRATVS
jgi:hypothetical protein